MPSKAMTFEPGELSVPPSRAARGLPPSPMLAAPEGLPTSAPRSMFQNDAGSWLRCSPPGQTRRCDSSRHRSRRSFLFTLRAFWPVGRHQNRLQTPLFRAFASPSLSRQAVTRTEAEPKTEPAYEDIGRDFVENSTLLSPTWRRSPRPHRVAA
jgi:hypothetical protein